MFYQPTLPDDYLGEFNIPYDVRKHLFHLYEGKEPPKILCEKIEHTNDLVCQMSNFTKELRSTQVLASLIVIFGDTTTLE